MKTFLLLLLLLTFCFYNILAGSSSVIIVGAGPAGIAAAAKLLQNSITNVTILEAENRIGGRVNSVQFGDGWVDVGAEYCHGEEGNVVYEMVKDLNVLQHADLFTPAKMYYSNGSIIDEQLATDLKNIITNYVDGEDTESGISLADLFLSKYNVTVLKKYNNDEEKLKVAKEAINFAHGTILMHEGAFHWQKPAAGRHYQACPGDQMMVWKTRGYRVALDVLTQNFPNPDKKLPIDDNIFFNNRVTKIIWNRNRVIVKTFNNSSFTADHVIFTPSVGVLNHNHQTLFEPPLPKTKQSAIEAMGFDGIIKVVIHFPKKWWKDDDTAFLFLWSSEDLANIKNEFDEGPSSEGISWVANLMTLVKVPQNPSVWMGWVSGELVPEIERTSEEIIRRGCMYAIRKFLGKDYNVTEADKVIRSQWHTNPNFRGTYSYEKNGYYQKDVSHQNQLAEPLSNNDSPKVLFAGEATHPTHFSTVHGAIESGQREAQRVINLYL